MENSKSSTRQVAPRVGNEFPRTAKLLKHALFDQVYQGGQRHFSGLMTVFFLRRREQEDSFNGQKRIAGPRVGFTVGRVLGNSVTRNRIRRRMREAVRMNLGLLPANVDVVINPKKQVLEAEFPKIVAEVEKAFAAVGKRSCGEGSLTSPRRGTDQSPHIDRRN